MAISDDSNASDGLPNLPDHLIGLSGSKDTKAKSRQGDLKPDFQGQDPARTEAAKPPAEEDTHLGRNFGGYELVTKIGQGGMGLVYKGRQVSLDRVVAVKILSKALGDNIEFIKRFEREAKSIARISHPNIVAVYDFGKTDGFWYMVTEFIEGSNLAKMINEKLVLQLQEMLPLIAGCLAGLDYVSQSGIVHRDIKPDNILITRDHIAKIADFGLAKDVTNDTDLTAVGLAMGTPAYMSPEQCMGRRIDVRSDVYSLGVTAYYTLTGEKPFTGQSSFEIMTKQREHMPPPPFQLNPRLPREASDLIMKMMAKNASDRFSDADQCRQAWMDLGGRLGLLGSVTRSGEFKFAPPPAEPPKPVPPPIDLAPPLAPPLPPTVAPGAPAPLAAPGALPLPAISLGDPPSPPPSAFDRRSTPDFRAGESTADAAGKQAQSSGRIGTERRSVARATASTDATTCPRCGFLNRANAASCQRCAAVFKETEPASPKDQEAEAMRLFEQGSYKESAAIFAKLAERETDRRQRSVLRSKEREARQLEQEQQLAEINNRSQALVERGDLRGGIELLERGLGQVRESGASNADAENQLQSQINVLRQRIALGSRLKLLAVVAVIGVIVALIALVKLGILFPGAKPPAGTAPVVPPAPPAAPAAPTGAHFLPMPMVASTAPAAPGSRATATDGNGWSLQ